jgi:hypothetical protein
MAVCTLPNLIQGREKKKFNREEKNKRITHPMQMKLKGTYEIKVQHLLYQPISHK